jgi:septal ring factor EnvC (AmiA/AmiB activator)
MSFESVRPYVQLASGLGELAQARARDAAQGLLTLPAVGVATGTKIAAQAIDLADVMLATAAANRSNLTTLVRSEMQVAITALGLVPAQKLEEVQAEAARLRVENARLRTASSQAATAQRPARKAAAPKKAAKRAPSKSAKTETTARTTRAAVTTRVNPSRE